MKRIDWKFVGECAKSVGKGMAYGLALATVCGTKITVKRTYVSETAGYYEAVDSVMNSNMLDSYKRTVVEMIKPDGNSGYYKSVISVMESNMLDSYKRDTIEALSEK